MISLRPKEEKFFQLFEEGAAIVNEGALMLQRMMDRYETMDARLCELTELENKADVITDSIVERLNRTFITPLDREDIYTLARVLDDVLDYIHGTVERMVLYRTGKPTSDVIALIDVLVKATEEIKEGFSHLRNIQCNYNAIMKNCSEIKRLENEGDHLYRMAVSKLFTNGMEALDVIKWKEVYEHLETALDHCEDVGKLLKGVALKYA